MNPPSSFKLGSLSLSLKILCIAYIFTLLAGYGVSILQIYERSHFDMKRVVLYYRGETPTSDGEPQVMLPQSYATMLSVAHVHTLSQPMMFALLSLIFAFTGFAERTKAIFIAVFFAGSFISNLSPWLVRYAPAGLVVLLPLSQLMIGVCMLTMSFSSLKALWSRQA